MTPRKRPPAKTSRLQRLAGLLRPALPAVLLVAIAVAAWASGLLGDLTPAGFAREEGGLRHVAQAQPLLAICAYVSLYAVLVAACLPVAMILTLASGAIFGALVGGAATSVAATLAALAAYAAARSALAQPLLARVRKDKRHKALLERLKDNAFLVVLATRLTPGLPFSVVNIAAGVAAVPLRAYVPATLLAAIPMSFLFAALGASLGDALGDRHALAAAAHSPRVLLALGGLALLGLAPLAVRFLSHRRAQAA